MDPDDPARFRRAPGTAAPPSLNRPRAAGTLEASFGPGTAGKFGEGGSFQTVAGPLSAPLTSKPKLLTDGRAGGGDGAGPSGAAGEMVAYKPPETEPAWCPLIPTKAAERHGAGPWNLPSPCPFQYNHMLYGLERERIFPRPIPPFLYTCRGRHQRWAMAAPQHGPSGFGRRAKR